MNKIPANCTSSAQNKRLYYIAPEENLVIFLLLKVHMNSSIVHFHLTIFLYVQNCFFHSC